MEVTKGDYGFPLTFTIVEADGVTTRDLSTYTVGIKVWKENSSTNLFTGSCTNTDPTNGVCTYTVKITDFTTLGDYWSQLTLTKTGVIETTEKFRVLVKQDSAV